MKWKRLVVLAFGVFSGQAIASFLSAQELYAALKESESISADESKIFDSGEAYGYVFAIYDTYAGLAICMPADTTGRQVTKVTQNYLGQHPEAWNLPASVEVTKALTTAWPCVRK